METEMKHSPLPFDYHLTFDNGEPENYVITSGALHIAETLTGDLDQEEEDAHFIKIACNNHYNLIATIKSLLPYIDSEWERNESNKDIKYAKRALQLAEAKLGG